MCGGGSAYFGRHFKRNINFYGGQRASIFFLYVYVGHAMPGALYVATVLFQAKLISLFLVVVEVEGEANSPAL